MNLLFFSLLYIPHKSWYSWIINCLAKGVYAFGFLFMLPQLFLNYKLKSVAHLPWRAFMYKVRLLFHLSYINTSYHYIRSSRKFCRFFGRAGMLFINGSINKQLLSFLYHTFKLHVLLHLSALLIFYLLISTIIWSPLNLVPRNVIFGSFSFMNSNCAGMLRQQ